MTYKFWPRAGQGIKKMFNPCLLWLFSMGFSSGFSQSGNLPTRDYVNATFIKSIKFHHRGLVTSSPVIDLNTSGVLELSFDDMEGGDKRYRYEIVHCNRDWKPSDLQPFEYLDGFIGEEIDNREYSVGTVENYTHYTLYLPNNDVKWTKSGNYILAVYEDEGTKFLAFTRRFVVVENRVKILAGLKSPTSVSKIRTHHEVECEIDYKEFQIANPMNEVELVIMQNDRWDNAITGIAPKYISGTTIRFNYIDRLNFPALKEFRFTDIRSTKFLGEGVLSMDINRNGVDVLMKTDQKRTFSNYHHYRDLNGQYVIETMDGNNDPLTAEYVNVYFNLEAPGAEFDSDIYIVGEFTDWEIHPDFQMEYDPVRKLFLKEILLKQGYYDYYYAAVRDGIMSIEAIEGSWYETENNYSILVYYSEFGSRYDRVIGTITLNSADY